MHLTMIARIYILTQTDVTRCKFWITSQNMNFFIIIKDATQPQSTDVYIQNITQSWKNFKSKIWNILILQGIYTAVPLRTASKRLIYIWFRDIARIMAALFQKLITEVLSKLPRRHSYNQYKWHYNSDQRFWTFLNLRLLVNFKQWSPIANDYLHAKPSSYFTG